MALPAIVNGANITSAITGVLALNQNQKLPKTPCRITAHLQQTIKNLRDATKDLLVAAELLSTGDAQELTETCESIQSQWKTENGKTVAKKKIMFFIKSASYASQLKTAKALEDDSSLLLNDIGIKSATAKIALINLEKDATGKRQKERQIMIDKLETLKRIRKLKAELEADEET